MTEPEFAATLGRRVSRGSVVLGVAVALGAISARLWVHWALNYGPFAPSVDAPDGTPQGNLIKRFAVDPVTIMVWLAAAGMVLSVIPRTRRTGVGVLLGVALSGLVLLVVLLLIIQALRNSVF